MTFTAIRPFLGVLKGREVVLLRVVLSELVGIMMIDIAQQQAGFSFVNDQSDIPADTYRPEILIPDIFNLMKTHSW